MNETTSNGNAGDGTSDATNVHNHVARLSISTDMERKEMVSMIKSTIGAKDGPLSPSKDDAKKRRRRRRSSVQTTPIIPKKKKKVKPTELVVDPSSVTRKINVGDLRDLVLYVFDELPRNIKWLNINNRLKIEKVAFIFVPGLDRLDFGITETSKSPQPIPLSTLKYAPELEIFNNFFEYVWPTKSPGSKYRLYSSFLTLTNVPMNKSERKKTKEPNSGAITIHDLLMTVDEMIDNKYPIHSHYKKHLNSIQIKEIEALEKHLVEEEWVETTLFEHEGSKTFAIDCEMCLAGTAKVLTRVSIINFNNEVILDELVKPELEITDYVTRYSGITEELLQKAAFSWREIQQKILSVVSSDDVLIGHSLESDLNVLKIKHKNMVDTALIYDHKQGPPMKPSLKWLVQNFLYREIQNSSLGHDSIEDAKACMDLVKLKISNDLGFGKVNTASIDIFSKLNSKAVTQCISGNKLISDEDIAFEQNIDKLKNNLRTALLVDYSKPAKFTGKPFNLVYGEKVQCHNDEEAVQMLIDGVKENDFLIGRLREAEFEFGWTAKPEELKPTKSINENEKAYESIEKSNEKESKLTKSEPDRKTVFKNVSQNLKKLIDSLPNYTLLIVFTSHGDPRAMLELQKKKKEFQSECVANVAPNSSWTLKDDEKLQEAVEAARESLSFIGLKHEPGSTGDSLTSSIESLGEAAPLYGAESAIAED